MSDHDPNGDDNFLKPPVVIDPKPSSSRYSVHHKTNMFPAYVPDPMKQAPQHELSQVSGVAPTVEMPEVPAAKFFTIQTLVEQLIEKNVSAWKALPSTMRDAMLSTPHKFQWLYSQTTNFDHVPSIIYNGVCLIYGKDGSKLWSVDRLYL